MKFKDGYKEKEVINKQLLLRNGEISINNSFTDFVVSKTDGSWVITFSYLQSKGIKLKAKDNSVRRFARLNGVESFMRKIKISTFLVELA